MGAIDMVRRELRVARLFADLSAADLAVLAAGTHARHCARDEVIFLKGDRPAGFFVVVSGMVKLACQSSSGRERVIELAGPGQVFGESSLVLGSPHPYMASALSEVALLHVDGGAIDDLLDRSPGFAKRLLTHISGRVYAGMRDVVNFRAFTPLERVIGFLIDQSKKDSTDGDATVVALEAPKHVLASRLGMTPESLSRALRDLSDSGLIAVGADNIRLLDRDRLWRRHPLG